MTDQEWMRQFEEATLPNESFHHSDHVKMAFLYLQHYAPVEALDRFSAALRHFAKAHGKADRYHETVTWAFLFLIRERLARAGSPCTWDDFASRNPDLLRWDGHILNKFYRPETLSSQLAKNVFVFPDKL